ncbi:MAG: hypothetical protein HKL80_00120 [Acidimicrobiales bacterium]|nr:hypothetical protein [Acidimicrobiales bacterium]
MYWTLGATDNSNSALPEVGKNTLFQVRPSGPLIVFGKNQKVEDIDILKARKLGFRLARRKGGGSAVIVEPGNFLWFELTYWKQNKTLEDPALELNLMGGILLEAMEMALPALKGRLVINEKRNNAPNSWPQWCFSSLGSGEIALDQKKVLGMALYRNRERSTYFVGIPLNWDQNLHLELSIMDKNAELESNRESWATPFPVSNELDLTQAVLEVLNRPNPSE